MKRIKRFLAALTICVLLCSNVAMADLQRGDHGEDVQWLQQLLIETGWLFEEADGVFGKNTQQAVMKYQSYKGLEQTGIADDALIAMLTSDMTLLDHKLAVSSFDTDGAGSDGRGTDEYCYTIKDIDQEQQSTRIVYCPVHAALTADTEELMMDGDFDEAFHLYEDELTRLYAAWGELLGEENAESVYTAQENFLQSVEGQNVLFTMWYGEVASNWQRCELLRRHIAFLCEIVQADQED